MMTDLLERLRHMSVFELISNLQSCTFENEAGPLVNNMVWRALIERVKTYRGQAMQSGEQSILVSMLLDVQRFNRDIIGVTLPESPVMLHGDRMQSRVDHLEEELQEFRDAWGDRNMEKMADALLDLIYVALGGLLEMGIAPGAAFAEVHRANMDKERGTVARRPNSGGNDAIKPEGWKPPDLGPYLTMTRDDVLRAAKPGIVVQNYNISTPDADSFRRSQNVSLSFATPQPAPRLLIIGHARHGKDTMAERLRDEYDLRFTSSSMFCAERVIWPLIQEEKIRREFLGGLTDDRAGAARQLYQMLNRYKTVEECFHDRGTYRSLWYEAIRAFNRPDPTSLAVAILEDHDVYCGMRSSTELHACRNVDVFDHVIWIDASQRVGPEDRSSCTVEPWMADHVVDANGSVEEGAYNLDQLMRKIL